MKLRLTPLNLVAAFLLVTAAYFFFRDDRGLQGLIKVVPLIIISLITDLIFRTFLKDIKRIWIIEGVFLIFTVIIILVLRAV